MRSATPSITISFQDIVDRRAFIQLSPDAMVNLCHMAGAPWNPAKPDAELSPLQREIFSRKEREKIVHGGSGLGKSLTCGLELACETMLPYKQVALGAAGYDHVFGEFQYIHRFFQTHFQKHPQGLQRNVCKNQANYHEYDVQTVWGSRCVGVTTENDEGANFLGKSYDKVGLGEGSHVSPVILDTRILRALDRAMGASPIETGYLSIYTTPRGYEGCSAAEWERVLKQTDNKPEKLHYGKVPFARTVWLREASVLENPTYSTEAFEARRDTLDKQAFEEQYLGKMTWRTGMIFPELDVVRHIRPLPKYDLIRKMRLGFGMDTGAYFGGAFVGMYEVAPGFRQRWNLGSVYTEQQTITESLEMVKEVICRILGPVYGLSEHPDESFEIMRDRIDVWAIDPASQHKMEVNEALGIGAIGPQLGLLDSLDRMRTWIKRDEYFFAEHESDALIDQLKKYVWKAYKMASRSAGGLRNPIVVEPKKGYDHVIDAWRLVSHAVDEMGPIGDEPDPISIAEAWDDAQRKRIFGPLREMMERGERMGGIRC